MAPFDRRPQSPLTCLSIAAALEQIETLRDPLQDLPRRQYRRARGSELERQRQVVEDSAECGDGCVGLDTRPLTEEVDRLRFGERQHAVLDFASDAQALPTRDEDAEIRARFEQRREVGSRFDDLLEVVEQEQHLAVADVRVLHLGLKPCQAFSLQSLVVPLHGHAFECHTPLPEIAVL